MELVAATSSVLSAIESLLIVLDDRVQERLFRTDQRQPGSISRSLLRTQGRLTSKLPHLADQHLKIMMLGPVANTLERRINEMAAPEVGLLPLVKRRLLDDADSLRVAALGAKSRVTALADRAKTLQSKKSQLLSTHSSLMSRLSGEAVLDQQIRREITAVEKDFAAIEIEEGQIATAVEGEASVMRQQIDALTQFFAGMIRTGFVHPQTDRDSQAVDHELYDRFSELWCDDSSHAGFWENLIYLLKESYGRPLGTDNEYELVQELFFELLEKNRVKLNEFIKYGWQDKLAFLLARNLIVPTLRFSGVLEGPFGKYLLSPVSKLKSPSPLLLDDILASGNVGRPGWESIFKIHKWLPRHTRNFGREVRSYKSLFRLKLPPNVELSPGRLPSGTLKFAGKAFYWVGAAWDGYSTYFDEHAEKVSAGRDSEDAQLHGIADGLVVGGTTLAAGAGGAAIGTALFPGVGTVAGFVVGAGFSMIGNSLSRKLVDTEGFENTVDSGAEKISGIVDWISGR